MATSTTTTSTTAAPKPAASPPAASNAAPQSAVAAATEAKKLPRLLPASPWTRAAAAEKVSADKLLEIRKVVDPLAPSILLWAQALPSEGTDLAGMRLAWGDLKDLSDAQVRVVMRAMAEQVGGEYLPGEAV